ncbi:Hypothetical predicted protein [Mytilus galloprovincialis]|nr:Hypothetical predicted protein [Mytilus galloprovincialis]
METPPSPSQVFRYLDLQTEHSVIEDNNNTQFITVFEFLKNFCGSSTVAIDNKIEQAMDLVKSHLMYAVREEVEVLKEQIKELMDKNQQLEYENQILKNSASPETLSKLTSPSSSS